MNTGPRWTLLLVVIVCGIHGCTSNAGMNNKYLPVIDDWVEQDKAQPPPRNAIVFIGSSSIRRWDTLKDDFPRYDVIQRGFGGSTFADANLFVDKIVTPYEPAAVVVFEGSNDIARGRSGRGVFKDYKQFVKLVRQGSDASSEPVPIFFIGITPTPSRWKHWPQVKIANGLIRAYAEQHDGLYYIDTVTPIMGTAPEPGGPPSHDLFIDDLLHLNETGYALWVEYITPALQSVVPPTKKDKADN